MQLFAPHGSHAPDQIQRFSMFLMSLLVLLTFVGTNMQALLWQSSDWLVSTVLPAVVIDLTNEQRVENNRSQLVRNSVLDKAAAAKAQHMADNEYFAHFAPDGTTPWEFFADQGYVYAHAGENLAIHFTDSAEVVEAWMLSPAHKKNIVDPKFREIGVGTARGTFDGYDTVYVVQLFGTPAIAPAIPDSAPTPSQVVAEIDPGPTPLALGQTVEQPPEISAVEVPPQAPEEVLAAADTPTQPTTQPVTVSSGSAQTQAIEPVHPQTDQSVPSELTASMANDVVVIQTELSTSSGLAVATMIDASTTHAGATMASIATRPNLVLQSLYLLLATVIIISLSYSLVMGARRMQYVQVAYSLALMLVMGGLWLLHTTITSGAVIA